MISFAAIVPHPPIIVPGISNEEDLAQVKRTVLAMEILRDNLEKIKPDTIIMISPHAPFELNSFGVNAAKMLDGDFSVFGSNKQLEFRNNNEISEKIVETALAKGIRAHFYDSSLDHGVLVPLYYLAQNTKAKLVHLSFTGLDIATHYHYGELIGEVFQNSSEKIAVIASGDLSHRLIPGAPAGYSPKGQEFDRELINLLAEKNIKGILGMNEFFIGEAGECGLRSIVILLGTLKNADYSFELLSYEGPFGVGYMVSRLL